MMQRPVMNPAFYDDAPPPRRARFSRLRRLLRLASRAVVILLSDPFRDVTKLKVEDGTPLHRFLRGACYRMAFAPVVVVLFVVALVYAGTRPTPRLSAEADPVSQGVYYDPVDYLSSDGTRLQAWLVPAVDARSVLRDGATSLTSARPAVILAHGFGASRQQMLPLVKPLHDAGFVVMVVALRGSGTPEAAGQTFGLNESLDVLATIDLLRRRPFVDADRIAIVGTGTGANAALLAARRDLRLGALVLDGPFESTDAAIRRWVGPRQAWLAWIDPLCKWAFEMSYGVDAQDIDLDGLDSIRARVPTFMSTHSELDSAMLTPTRVNQIESFLRDHLPRSDASAAVGG